MVRTAFIRVICDQNRALSAQSKTIAGTTEDNGCFRWGDSHGEERVNDEVENVGQLHFDVAY